MQSSTWRSGVCRAVPGGRAHAEQYLSTSNLAAVALAPGTQTVAIPGPGRAKGLLSCPCVLFMFQPAHASRARRITRHMLGTPHVRHGGERKSGTAGNSSDVFYT
jgi:hypothetical protein